MVVAPDGDDAAGIAFLAIVTAAITSTFVARAEQERALAEAVDDEARSEARFDELAERLDRLESMLRQLGAH